MGEKSSVYAANLQKRYRGLTQFTYFQAKDQTWYECRYESMDESWECRKAMGGYKTHAA